ncbi:MAG: fumarylacetoacetate hydrolase family protein, partial [candidate division Zixibacteria bacterium]|nr:fumarylacetoacetate hydrolase family protein [candidate division Zixibacteria bacterium]
MEQYVRCALSGVELFGRLDGTRIEILDGPYYERVRPTGRFVDIDQVKLLCPVASSKIILVGLNYRKHVQHSQSATETPANPVLFLKPSTALLEPNGNIIYPEGVDRVDYEAELGVVIGGKGHCIPVDRADDYIFGYTCVNDVTARKIQKLDGQWTRGKGFDTFCPVGPYVVRGIDASDLSVEAYLNGQRKQYGRTSELIFRVYSRYHLSSRKTWFGPECRLFFYKTFSD